MSWRTILGDLPSHCINVEVNGILCVRINVFFPLGMFPSTPADFFFLNTSMTMGKQKGLAVLKSLDTRSQIYWAECGLKDFHEWVGHQVLERIEKTIPQLTSHLLQTPRGLSPFVSLLMSLYFMGVSPEADDLTLHNIILAVNLSPTVNECQCFQPLSLSLSVQDGKA